MVAGAVPVVLVVVVASVVPVVDVALVAVDVVFVVAVIPDRAMNPLLDVSALFKIITRL